MKKTVVIVVLGLLVLGLGGYIVYDKVISDDRPENVVNEEEKEQVLSKEIELSGWLENMITIKLEVKDNKLVETNYNIPVEGVSGNVDKILGGYLSEMYKPSDILVYTKDKKIYIASIEYNSLKEDITAIEKIVFNEIKLNYNFKDVTVYDDFFAVILNDGAIHIIGKDDDTDEVFLKCVDYSQLSEEEIGYYPNSGANYAVFKDNTLGGIKYNDDDWPCKFGDKYTTEKISYKNEVIKVKKAYVTVEFDLYLISDDNYLYKVDAYSEGSEAKLVENKIIKSTSYSLTEKHSYFYDDDQVTEVITFEDGSTRKILKVQEILELK